MEFIRHYSATDFLAVSRDFLEAREADNNLILGITTFFAAHPDKEPEDVFFFTVLHEGRAVLGAMNTPSHDLVVTIQTPEFGQAINLLCWYLARNQIWLSGVNIELPFADTFVKYYQIHTQATANVFMKNRLLRLEQVIPPRPVNGTLRLATSDDASILTEWFRGFDQDALGVDITIQEAEKALFKQLGRQSLFVWEDAGLVSMTNVTRQTWHGVAINYVFTPKAYRGRGYASALVAAVSQEMLNRGLEFCVLYADVDNPTSMGIYRKIGYEPLEVFVNYKFYY